jgi:hypothetical protein
MNPDGTRPQFTIQIVDVTTARTRLAELAPNATAELDGLLDLAARGQVEIIELALAATFFAGANNLPKIKVSWFRKVDPEFAVMACMVPEDQADRLAALLNEAGRQLGG